MTNVVALIKHILSYDNRLPGVLLSYLSDGFTLSGVALNHILQWQWRNSDHEFMQAEERVLPTVRDKARLDAQDRMKALSPSSSEGAF